MALFKFLAASARARIVRVDFLYLAYLRCLRRGGVAVGSGYLGCRFTLDLLLDTDVEQDADGLLGDCCGHSLKHLVLNPGKTPEEGVENLAKAVEDYRDNKLGMNKSFQECGVDEDYFWSVLDQIGMRAYEDQCAPANPRIPQIEDMKDIAIAAYYGVSQAEGHKLRVQRQGEAATEEASERA